MEWLVPFVLLAVCVLVVTAWLTRVANYAPVSLRPPSRRISDAPVRQRVPALPPQQPAPLRSSVAGDLLSSQDGDRLLVADIRGLPPLYLQHRAGELWLTESTTGRLVGLGDRSLAGLGIWIIWLRNIDSRTIVAREGLLHPGATVRLQRDPGPLCGANGISVHAATGRRVGCVSPLIAARLTRVLDAGTTLQAVAVAFTPSPPQAGPPKAGLD
ncbi:hypothetical protein E3T26_05435 [Cryobacterium sp. TMT1-21]|uniref:hypothetical protein n=1 Tax=unclassified Cryobacterium TaxID=2649013 RepID=UPI00106DBF83|nr:MULTISPECIES: hypothetical protein [unclassified Cryobacterium]TFC83686.1 hypothetical protein E3T24_11860 [Cryobacterium sp. TmT2-59]TFD13659.1 hypothetical protein E3T42_13370 [Cryobacterium sp. TMT4-10]TFD15978.1 hypothetical protein E3T26_05435 [Cryobacterium sp. TMT1-21]TFD38295.1 hypothetical protein E3T37_10455 [Cryobacterium sp. TMT2-10]